MKLSFAQKLWLPLVLGVLCLAGISVYNAYDTRDIRLAERKAELMHASEIALSVVKTFGDLASAGTLPAAQAQRHAMDSIRNMRYGDEGYFVILDSNPTILMHPIQPASAGKYVGDVKDRNGVYFYRDIVSAIRRDGNGFVSFAFPKPGA